MQFSSPLWIAGVAVLGLVANVVVLTGCVSPATKDIALYRVNLALLADALEELAVGYKSDNRNRTQLLRSDLPTYWYWGMSGICNVFETTGETRCLRAFPPTPSLVGLLEDSLRDSLDDNQEQKIKGVVDSWNVTLNSTRATRLAANSAGFAAKSKASASLVVAAAGLDGAAAFLALCPPNATKKRLLHYAPAISGLLTLSASALAWLSMQDGVQGVAGSAEQVGPAIIALLVGGMLRLLYYGGAGFGACKNSSSEMTRNEKIGFEGEFQMYSWFKDRLPGWSPQNWTSRLRKHAGFPDFTEPEWQYADFTYDDVGGDMLQLLRKEGVPVSPDWSARTRYHIEVKSTTAGCDAEFFVSQYQVQRMRECANDRFNAYILVRVFQGQFPVPWIFTCRRFFVDPRPGIHPGLLWGPLRDDGYYPVRTVSAPNIDWSESRIS